MESLFGLAFFIFALGIFATFIFYTVKAFLGGKEEIKKIVNLLKIAWVPLLIITLILLASFRGE